MREKPFTQKTSICISQETGFSLLSASLKHSSLPLSLPKASPSPHWLCLEPQGMCWAHLSTWSYRGFNSSSRKEQLFSTTEGEKHFTNKDMHISAKVRDEGSGWSNTGQQSHAVHEMCSAVFIPGRTFGEEGRSTVPPLLFMMRELGGWWNNWVGLSHHQLNFVSKAPATSL